MASIRSAVQCFAIALVIGFATPSATPQPPPATESASSRVFDLLRIGAGLEARRVGRAAVEASESDPDAQFALGLALSHDLMGRPYRAGADPAGATKAYLRAIALAPQERQRYAGRLSSVAPLSPDGILYGRGADLETAVVALRRFYGEGESILLYELSGVLAATGRYHELSEELRFAGRKDGALFGYAVEAQAMLAGPEAAIAFAQTEERERFRPELVGALVGPAHSITNQGLRNAGMRLARFRRYPEARTLLDEVLEPDEPFLDTLAQMRRHEELDLSADTPQAAVQRWLKATLASEDYDEDWLERLRPLVSRCGKAEIRDATRGGFYMIEVRGARSRMDLGGRKLGPHDDFVLDRALSTTELFVEGDDRVGYRVRLKWPNYKLDGYFFVVRQQGRYKILDVAHGPMVWTLSDLGCEALRRVDAGELTQAVQLLDWVANIDRSRTGYFQLIWNDETERTPGRVRAAAAFLQARDASRARKAAQILEVELRTSLQDQPGLYAGLRNISIAWELAGEMALAISAAEEARYQFPGDVRATTRVWQLLGRAGHRDSLREEFEQALRTDPLEYYVAIGLALGAVEARDRQMVEKILFKLNSQGADSASDWSRLARVAVFTDTVDDAAVAAADIAFEIAVAKDGGKNELVRDARAAVYALAGKPQEAMEMLRETLGRSSRVRPDQMKWFVHGLVMEKSGFAVAALDSYRRAIDMQVGAVHRSGPAAAAQERLALLTKRVDAEGARDASEGSKQLPNTDP